MVTLQDGFGGGAYAFDKKLLTQIAFCRCVLKGSIYLQASQSDVATFFEELAKRRKMGPRVDGKPYRCFALLECGDRLRLEQYQKCVGEKENPITSWDLNVDLAQAPPFGTAQEFLPTLVRNSRMYNIQAGRFFLPVELLAAHGIPTLLDDEEIKALVPGPLLHLCETFPKKAGHLIGNSMCAAQVGAVFGAALMNVL